MIKKLLRWMGWMRPCSHSKIRHAKWNGPDGCPMIMSTCQDCGWTDEGHVYGDPWTDEQLLNAPLIP